MENLISLPEEQALAAYNGGCEECVKSGATCVHLRMCLICGKVGCCDSSPNQHAWHWRETGHDVMRSLEPGESWMYDFETDQAYALTDTTSS